MRKFTFCHKVTRTKLVHGNYKIAENINFAEIFIKNQSNTLYLVLKISTNSLGQGDSM